MAEKVQVSVDMSPELKEKVRRAAEHLSLSSAALVRLACIEYADKVLETKTETEPNFTPEDLHNTGLGYPTKKGL